MYYHYIKTDAPSQNMFFRHMHNDYEILYFTEGDAEFIIEGAVCSLKKGDLLIIGPRVYHYLRLKSQASYERFVINFTENEVCHELIENLKSKKYFIYGIEDGSCVNSFFNAWKEYENIFSDRDKEIFIDHGIVSILTVLKYTEERNDSSQTRPNRTLEAIIKYIDKHPDRSITAETLSTEFYVSVSWIVHIFRSQLGISLMQYVNKKRMLYAQQMIFDGFSPTEVALKCNFDNYATFYRQYKKVIGKSPKEDKK